MSGQSEQMNWAYGITTVPDRVDTLLPDTLSSLAAAGFDKPVLFVDGMQDEWLPPSLSLGGLVIYHPKVGHVPNWMLALLHLYTTHSSAQRYAIFEDDLLATKNLRAYLDYCQYPECGYWNLVTHPENLILTQNIDGWHESNQKGRGAVGLVFNRKTARDILSSHIFLDRPAVGAPCPDGMVMDALHIMGYKEYIHCPTLLQHTGGNNQSVLGHKYGEMPGWRGEDFDLFSIEPAPAVVPIPSVILTEEEQQTVLHGNVRVIIPTQKQPYELRPLVRQILNTAGINCDIFVTGIANGSAAVNRNRGLEWAGDAEWVCMIDDDCEVPYDGWLKDLALVMARPEVAFVSAALYSPTGEPAYMTGLHDCGGTHQESGEWCCPTKRILTACCAFKPHGLRFDENYLGSGFEDTDYCNQLSRLRPDDKFVVSFRSKVVHANEMKEQRNNWNWNKIVYHSKWIEEFKPIVALYKTYRGGEWFEASLESIHKHVDGIVVVSSHKPWSMQIEQLPENCLEPLKRFCQRHPELPVTIVNQEDQHNQGSQYLTGLKTVANTFGTEVGILVIDSDEVWDDDSLKILKAAMTLDPNTSFFRTRIHNYIKHPYWRISPQEPHRPVVGLRNAQVRYIKGRFCGLDHSHYRDLPISYHHFPLVRLDESEIFHKLQNTASQDGPCFQDWITRVWDHLPAGKNIHPAIGYERCWEKVETINPKSLPRPARDAIVFNRMMVDTTTETTTAVPTTVLERHIAGYHRRLETMPELFDLEFWRKQESYTLLKQHCQPTDSILEIGCLNGHHCLLLALDGYKSVKGIEFNGECVQMANEKKHELGLNGSPSFLYGEFPYTTVHNKIDKIVLFDVIEHMTNLQTVFEECANILDPGGTILVLVPKGKHYYDSGHINFWPDEETLTNHLTVYFNVLECVAVEEDKKIFARCNLRR